MFSGYDYPAELNAAFYSIIDYSYSLIEQQAMAIHADELSKYYLIPDPATGDTTV